MNHANAKLQALTPEQIVSLYLGSELMLRMLEREHSPADPPPDQLARATATFQAVLDSILDLPHQDPVKAQGVYALIAELPLGVDWGVCHSLKEVLDAVTREGAATERFED